MTFTQILVVITISETWLDNTIPDSDIAIHDYTIFRQDRDRSGRGVMVYAHELLPVKRRHDLEYDGLGSIWLEIRLPCVKILLATYYRPPGANEDEKSSFLVGLQSSIDKAFAENNVKSVYNHVRHE